MTTKDMDEGEYRKRAKEALDRVLDAFDDVDVDDADVESSGDVIHIRFRNGNRCVVNTQGPAKQIWLAGEGRGWHFSFDGERAAWISDKAPGEELFEVLQGMVTRALGRPIQFPSK